MNRRNRPCAPIQTDPLPGSGGNRVKEARSGRRPETRQRAAPSGGVQGQRPWPCMVGAAAGTGHTSAAMSAAHPPESQIAESPVDESPPPVVLQVLPSLVTGGVERGTIEITQAVAEAGGVALVASAGGRMVSQVAHAGGRHIELPLDTRNPVAVWRNARRLAALIRRERVVIVHARSRAPAWSAWLACRRTGAHFVTTYHGTYAENLPFKRVYNSVMARGEIVIAASRFISALVKVQHGVPA